MKAGKQGRRRRRRGANPGKQSKGLALRQGLGMIANKNSGQKRKRNRQARERSLLAAATKLFATQGYEATTTREIAATARCAEGLIHRYFQGKAGLLAALVQTQLSQNGADLAGKVPPARKLEDEVFQLVRWEVERVWGDRDFLRVIIPQMLTDSTLARTVERMMPQALQTKAIEERLQRHEQCRTMPGEQVEALAQLIGAVGFVFGFVRPVVLRHDHTDSREAAGVVASLLMRAPVTAAPAT